MIRCLSTFAGAAIAAAALVAPAVAATPILHVETSAAWGLDYEDDAFGLVFAPTVAPTTNPHPQLSAEMAADLAAIAVLRFAEPADWEFAGVMEYKADRLQAEEFMGTEGFAATRAWRGYDIVDVTGVEPFVSPLAWAEDGVGETGDVSLPGPTFRRIGLGATAIWAWEYEGLFLSPETPAP